MPSILICPADGSYSLNIKFNIVLFPAPLSPTIAINYPYLTLKESFSIT